MKQYIYENVEINYQKLLKEICANEDDWTCTAMTMQGINLYVDIDRDLSAQEKNDLDQIILNHDPQVPDYVLEVNKTLQRISNKYDELKQNFASENSVMGIRQVHGKTKELADLFQLTDYYMNAYSYREAFVEFEKIPTDVNDPFLHPDRISAMKETLHQFIYGVPYVANDYLVHEGA